MVWHNLGLNPGLLDHWQTLYPLGQWAVPHFCFLLQNWAIVSTFWRFDIRNLFHPIESLPCIFDIDNITSKSSSDILPVWKEKVSFDGCVKKNCIKQNFKKSFKQCNAFNISYPFLLVMHTICPDLLHGDILK